MGILMLNHIKKQAASFLQEKYKIARIAFTDVTEAELLAEDATNEEACSPDARTMSKIAVASFDVDDYWRIVDILHRKIDNADWKLQWRQSYKAMVLLEYLLTHGPEDLAEEFLYDIDAIRELGTFQCIDEKGFDWGVQMQKRSDNIQTLLLERDELKKARLQALKVSRVIKGFGNSPQSSPTATDATSPASSSPFGSSANASTPPRKEESENQHDWSEETGSLIKSDEEHYEEMKTDGLISGICSKLVVFSPLKKFQGDDTGFRSFSNVEKVSNKKFDRQYSLGY